MPGKRKNAPVSGTQPWIFRLYVADQTPKSFSALQNLEKLCNDMIVTARIRVIDLLEQPHLASEHQIIALPTLVRTSPLPVKRIVGDLSDGAAVRSALGLRLDAHDNKE